MGSSTSPKAYLSMLKYFQNNKKISCTPVVFNDNRSTTNFIEKAKLFNTFFADQSSNVEL